MRSALLAALFGALKSRAIDEGIELFDQLIEQTRSDLDMVIMLGSVFAQVPTTAMVRSRPRTAFPGGG